MIDIADQYCTDQLLRFNKLKSKLMQFLPRIYQDLPTPVVTLQGTVLQWVGSAVYLGAVVSIDDGCIHVSISDNLRKFFGTFNSIFNLSAGPKSLVAASLCRQYCSPMIQYASEFQHLFKDADSAALSVAHNNSVRRVLRLKGVMRQQGYYGSNVTATHTAAGGETFDAISEKRALALYRSTLRSTNPIVNLLALRLSGFLRHRVEHVFPATRAALHAALAGVVNEQD